MDAGGVPLVAGIQPVVGEPGDYYDARGKVLRLTHGVHGRATPVAVGIAAHEAGHAIQDASGYRGMALRNLVVPLVGLGSQVAWTLLLAGVLIGMMRLVGLAIALFSSMVVVLLLELPIELDASRRGREGLRSSGMIANEEDPIVADVLNAAAWIHIAGALTGVLWLFRDPFQLGRSHRARGD
jgi:Zn-dependent membrane protease YugP